MSGIGTDCDQSLEDELYLRPGLSNRRRPGEKDDNVKLGCAAALLAALLTMAAGRIAFCQKEANVQPAAESNVNGGPLRPPGMAERAWLARQEATRTGFIVIVVVTLLTLFLTLGLHFARRRSRRPKHNAHEQRDARRSTR